ncbi:MAG: ECF transporter S component [Limnochordales bacterium]|nr:ECF transporter S component [Limnochordales bacterium]
MSRTRYLARLALLVAVGVLLPLITHVSGVPGPVFLPMHLPVLLAGFLLGPPAGLLVGIAAPLGSFALTGRPPLTPPVLPVMVIELVVYGTVAGLGHSVLVHRTRLASSRPMDSSGWLPFLFLPVAMLAGRFVMGLAIWLLGPLFGWPFQACPYVVGATLTGLPGIILQLALIPPLVRAIGRIWQ